MLARVRATVRRHGMFAGGERVVVAVSGGPDSMALLDVLRRLCTDFRLDLRVAHVDHGLHARSEAHAAFVERVARRWGLPVSVRRVDARAYAVRTRLSLEAAARIVRYRALAVVARRAGASHLALGHTADDQVETVLLWLLRGAGPDSLAGMPAVRPHDGLRVVRPLIELWRSDVMAYLAAARVPYRRDPTNRLRAPLRNRIRHELLPDLLGYNPGVKAVLRRLAESAADDAALLDHLAAQAAAGIVRSRRGRVAIAADRFRALPPSLQRRVAYRALAAAGGNIRKLAYVHIERLRAMAAGATGVRADLPGLRAERTGADVVLARARRARGRA